MEKYIMKYKFVLIQKARSSGGDKYSCEGSTEWVIYFPQEISRPDKKEPRPTIEIEVNDS